MKLLQYLIPIVLLGGTFFLLGWVIKSRFIDKKPVSSASQMLAQQTLMDLRTDEGRQALVEQIEMQERPAADADGERLPDEPEQAEEPERPR